MLKKDIDKILDDPYNYANTISVKKLEKILKELSDAYYNGDEAIVNDTTFDILKEVLEERDPNNIFLKQIGAPITKKKVALPYPMGSLDKIKPGSGDLDKWMKKYGGPYVVSDKLDGISAQLYKDSKGVFWLFTRGDGIEGQDITHLLKNLIKKNTKLDNIPNGTSIRGEIIISKNNFEKIKDKMANARNAAAGLVNSKTVDIDVAKLAEFIVYAIIYPEYKQIEQMKKLTSWNFNVVHYTIMKQLSIEKMSKLLGERRKDSEYEVDGIVVVDSSQEYKVGVGTPKYAFAFKNILEDQISMAKVVDVIWNISKDGLIKPIIQIEPVKLVGTTITYVTAFNAKYISDNKLGPGATIKIIRSGDVIPHIMEIIKPATQPKMPSVPYTWSKTGVDIIATGNGKEPMKEIKIKQLVHFFKILDIKNISEGVVTKMAEKGYDTIFKVLAEGEGGLATIEGLGEKSVGKIFDNIRYQLANTNLETLMAASNIFGGGLGVKKLKLIVDKIPNILKTNQSDEELYDLIMKIEGFSDISTRKFLDNLNKFKTYFNMLNKYINITYLVNQKEKKKKHGNIFKDVNIVFTGFRNKEWEDYVVENGGKLSSNVSSNTTLLVYSENSTTSSKYIKAENMGIEMLSQEEFQEKYDL